MTLRDVTPNRMYVGVESCYSWGMKRRSGVPVLEMDAVGRYRAKREMEVRWDATEMMKRQDRHAVEMWEAAGRPPSWDRTIVRLPRELH